MLRSFKISKYLNIIFCFIIFLNAISVNAAGIDLRLESEEGITFESYSKSPIKTLKEAIEESDAIEYKLKQFTDLEMKNILKQYDSPENSNLLEINLSEVSRALQFRLADLRIKALKNNLSIKVAKVSPKIAATEVRREEAKFDQIFYVYARYGENDDPLQTSDYVGFNSENPSLNNQQVKLSTLAQENKSLDVEAGIKVPLRTGGTIVLSAPLSNKKISRNSGQFNSDTYQSAMRFSFSQPLLRNAGREINEASISIANLEQQGTTLNTRLQSIRIIAMVDKAYWQLYESWGELDIRRQQYEYAQQNLQMVKKRVAEGLTARVEISRSEIGVADRFEALIIAETNLKRANRQLQFLLNDISDNPSLEAIFLPTTPPNLVKYDIDRKKLMSDALAGRIELLTQELKLSADLASINYLENQTLPLFTVDYQYGALSNTFDSFESTYNGMFNSDFNDWYLGFKFELPISNELNKSRLDRAIQQRNQRFTTKALQELTIKKEIYNAVDQIEQNWQRILAARQQVLIAGINYEAELKQFNEGIRTMTEVLETLTRLGEAQIKEIKAIGDYQIALVDTAYATGTLLGYSKLDFTRP